MKSCHSNLLTYLLSGDVAMCSRGTQKHVVMMMAIYRLAEAI